MFTRHLLLLGLLTAGPAAAQEGHRRKKTTEPPQPSYSEYVSVYTSLTLIPMDPTYQQPYQPYPDTAGVNQGGPAGTTVTDTIYIEANPVTFTVTESLYFTQYITVAPPYQQCLASVPIPQPGSDPNGMATQIQPQYAPPPQPTQFQPQAAPSTQASTASTDVSGDGSGDDSGGDESSTSKRHRHTQAPPPPPPPPPPTTSRRRRF